MDEQIVDGTFRFRLLQTTPNGVLLKYLKSQSTVFSHELLLTAARAFWLSEAYLYFGVKQNSDLKKKVQHMIFALEDRANYLRMMFGIEPRPTCGCGNAETSVRQSLQRDGSRYNGGDPRNALPWEPPQRAASHSLPELGEIGEEELTVWDSTPQIETGGL